MVRRLLLGAVALWSIQWATAAVAQDGDPPFSIVYPPDAAAQPRLEYWRQPYYPRSALVRKIEGKVTVRFSVNKFGLVENAHVIDSTPALVFDKQAVDGISGWVFAAPMVDGKKDYVDGIQVTIPFTLDKSILSRPPLVFHHIDYPTKADVNSIEGFCLMEYSVADDGEVMGVSLLKTIPGDTFKAVCLDTVKGTRFRAVSPEFSGHVEDKPRVVLRFRIRDGFSIPFLSFQSTL
jgi:TonB family protein